MTCARLSRCLAATGGDLNQAPPLYEKHAAPTEAVVPVRNSMHYVMSAALGCDDWYQEFPTAR